MRPSKVGSHLAAVDADEVAMWTLTELIEDAVRSEGLSSRSGRSSRS
jgi:hypothetical protein